jgi:hypothetical protein
MVALNIVERKALWHKLFSKNKPSGFTFLKRPRQSGKEIIKIEAARLECKALPVRGLGMVINVVHKSPHSR